MSFLSSDPSSLLVLAVTAACLLLGALVFVMQRDSSRGDAPLPKAKSLVDMSTSLRKEESSSSSEVVDDRVLNPLQFRKFKVLSVKKVSPNTKLIRFEIPHGRSLGLAIGKHISIQAHVDGNRVMRAYTPSSLIDQPGYFDLIVKAYEFGKMSPFLHNLRVGQEAEIRGPVGRFKYTANSFKRMGFIAGGTGLTPCMQVIRTILECEAYRHDETHFVFFFQNRSEDDIILHEELQQLQRKYAHRLQLFFFLSNATTESYGQAECEKRGYISSEMLQQYMHAEHCAFVGICGPSGFNDFVKKKLKEVGHEDQSIFVW